MALYIKQNPSNKKITLSTDKVVDSKLVEKNPEVIDWLFSVISEDCETFFEAIENAEPTTEQKQILIEAIVKITSIVIQG